MDPYHLLYRGGQFYLIGYSHERDDVRVFRVSRIRGKVGYSSKAEHDFNRPEDFDPRVVRHAHRLAARRPGGARAHLALGPHRLARAAPLRPRGRGARRRRRRDLRDRLRELAPDGLVGARPGRAGAHRGPGGARRRGTRAARARDGAPRAAAGAGATVAPAQAGRARGRRGRPRGADPAGALRAARHARRHPDRRRAREPQARRRPSCARRSR